MPQGPEVRSWEVCPQVDLLIEWLHARIPIPVVEPRRFAEAVWLKGSRHQGA